MQSVVLLDGGLGQEIYRRACNVSSPLWSVAVMQEQPEVVTAVHKDFIRVGATTLTLNTYTATPTRSFEDLSDEFAQLVKLQAAADVFLIETMTNSLEARAAWSLN